MADGRFEPGIRHGISATYLLLDPEATPQLLGYATLTFDSVRLTNSERKNANIRKVGWYEAAGLVANEAEKERDRTDPERSVSMRLDLLEGLHGAQADQRQAGRAAAR